MVYTAWVEGIIINSLMVVQVTEIYGIKVILLARSLLRKSISDMRRVSS